MFKGLFELAFIFLFFLPQKQTGMDTNLERINKAAEGLFFISESDHPFEPVLIEGAIPLKDALVQLAGTPEGAPLETNTLEYFFRNMVKVYPDATPDQQETAARFRELQKVLQEELQDVAVYRIGTIRVDAFIIGRLKGGGGYAGLRTLLIET